MQILLMAVDKLRTKMKTQGELLEQLEKRLKTLEASSESGEEIKTSKRSINNKDFMKMFNNIMEAINKISEK